MPANYDPNMQGAFMDMSYSPNVNPNQGYTQAPVSPGLAAQNQQKFNVPQGVQPSGMVPQGNLSSFVNPPPNMDAAKGSERGVGGAASSVASGIQKVSPQIMAAIWAHPLTQQAAAEVHHHYYGGPGPMAQPPAYSPPLQSAAPPQFAPAPRQQPARASVRGGASAGIVQQGNAYSNTAPVQMNASGSYSNVQPKKLVKASGTTPKANSTQLDPSKSLNEQPKFSISSKDFKPQPNTIPFPNNVLSDDYASYESRVSPSPTRPQAMRPAPKAAAPVRQSPPAAGQVPQWQAHQNAMLQRHNQELETARNSWPSLNPMNYLPNMYAPDGTPTGIPGVVHDGRGSTRMESINRNLRAPAGAR